MERHAAADSLKPSGGPVPAADVAKPLWFALATKPRHEKSISILLENKGYESFLPLHKRAHRYVRRMREFQVPVFPGYVFCRFHLHTRLPVLMTPGVIRMVGYGPAPVPVADEEIASLQAAVRTGLPLKPHPFVEAGRKVRLTEGPLAGAEGVVIRTKDPLRIVLSVTLLQRAVLVEVESNWVLPEPAHRQGPELRPVELERS